MLARMPATDIVLAIAMSVALGIGLAAAAGFRVFLPLLAASIAAATGHLHLNDNFAWLGSTPALIMFAVAAVVEILAYYIPAVDNLLDTITTPLALVAGTILSAAVITELSPLLKWSTAIISGGGAAVITQGLTTLVRAKSTAFTAGLANPVVSTGELIAATSLALLALLSPLLAVALMVALCWLAARLVRKYLRSPTP